MSRIAQLAEHVPVVMRLDDVDQLAGALPLLAADGHGEVGALASQFLDLLLERRALGAAQAHNP